MLYCVSERCAECGDRSRRTAITAPSAAWRNSRGYDSQGREKTLEDGKLSRLLSYLGFCIWNKARQIRCHFEFTLRRLSELQPTTLRRSSYVACIRTNKRKSAKQRNIARLNTVVDDRNRARLVET